MNLSDPIPHICTYCEYRHIGCDNDAIELAFDKGCVDFEIGHCLVCKYKDTDSISCKTHQSVFDYCGCDRFVISR